MSTPETVEKVLEHHGTKGMKWGVRRAENKIAKGDKKFAKRIINPRKNLDLKIELHNAAAKQMNEVHHPKLDKKYATAIKNHTLLDESHPTTKRYFKDVENAYMSEVNKAAAGMKNPSGTRQYVAYRSTNDFLGFVVAAKDVKHADTELYRVEYIKDDSGKVIGYKIVNASLTQSAIDNILEHHGVKGMKWGVRRKATVGPQEVIVSDKRKKIKTSGGEGHPAHPDAIRVRKTGQVAKKSGVKALSDQELQAYAKRIQLEHNVKRLQYHESSVPVKFVKTIMGQSGKKTSEMVADEGTRAVKRTLIKKFAKTAAVAAAA